MADVSLKIEDFINNIDEKQILMTALRNNLQA
jgi:hypothetical protein